ncbi:hypothetical protein RhiirA1_402102, partial [Rhizophagus irregularis]
MDEPSRRFETDETSRKDPQDASKLTKRPERRFKTDKTSWKDPQDASELMKRPEGTIVSDLRLGFGSNLHKVVYLEKEQLNPNLDNCKIQKFLSGYLIFNGYPLLQSDMLNPNTNTTINNPLYDHVSFNFVNVKMATDLEVSSIFGKQKSKRGKPLNSIRKDINKRESVGSELNGGYDPPTREMLASQMLEWELTQVNNKVKTEIESETNLTI